MASVGDTITYTYSGSQETEDISEVDKLEIDYMEGAGSKSVNSTEAGGLIENAEADVSSYSTLEIWVGGAGAGSGGAGGWGRANGGDGSFGDSGGGGGSTEIWTDGNSVFIAAADAAGGAGDYQSPDYLEGGGGARGGLAGSGDTGAATDAEGTGYGGDGGGNSVAEDGGQELGIASGGTTTKGGSSVGVDGEIQISYASAGPDAVSNVQITDAQTEDELTLDWDEVSGAAGYYVYRAEASGTSKSDYTQVADVTSPPYTDTALEDGEKFYYRVSSHD